MVVHHKKSLCFCTSDEYHYIIYCIFIHFIYIYIAILNDNKKLNNSII